MITSFKEYVLAEAMDDDPCWKNYKMVGRKIKNGKSVPNCVPGKGVPKMRKEDLEVNEASKEYEMMHFKELVKKYHRARRTNPTLAREIKKLAVTHWKTNIGGSDSYPPEDSFKMNEDKSEMACNKPRAQAHGSGETGKSHVVKACSGGKERLIRFGQLGVKGSPKKKGESEAYANRRKRFKTRHAKNIAKGKMSAAYWANKVKW